MDWWEAAIIGVVEGLTEYLPVSSTAHILLTQRALGIPQTPAADAYAVCVQAGAILAVLGIFQDRVRQMVRGLFGLDPKGLRLAINIVIAFLPAAVLGKLFAETIKTHLFHLKPICWAWFIGGLVILAYAYATRNRHGAGKGIFELSMTGAITIGLMQCLGMIPGTSRSLVTILGGLFVGLSMEAALEFSFLLGLVTLTAATVHDGYKYGSAMYAAYDVPTMAIGFVAASLAAGAAVAWMLHYLRRHGLAIFGYYRIALAAVVAILVWKGVVAP
ncbi:MAG TPA: undecaprenyl-diphosphate phosphatase [Gemmataceae bacterium]|nr:undecaprenyl-diphosphate phosphatase [Gemmataceae bacterium]